MMWGVLEQVSLYSFPLFFGVAFLLIKWYNSTSPKTSTKKLPPSPPTLPIIGNLHQIKGNPHHAFLSLAKRYGDSLMLIYLGSIPTLVVTSTEAAREIMEKHDLSFCSRPITNASRAVSYNLKDVTVSPYGEFWKQAKGLLTQHLLSTKSVQTFDGMRSKVISDYVSKINESFLCNKPVDLSDLFLSLANDVTCMVIFGRTYSQGETGKTFKKLIPEFSEILASFYFEDSIPQLAVVDRLRGLTAQVDRCLVALDGILQGAVDEMISKSNNLIGKPDSGGVKSFIEILFEIQKEREATPEFTIDTEVIKALLLDAYVPSSVNAKAVLEWAMTELLLHPDKMKKTQNEVRTVLNEKKDITNEDLGKMNYLKAVIKESTRLHPPVPIILPREAQHDVKVMGYDIPKGTRVYVNAYGMMRDPKVWDKPDTFMPERFLESSVDYVNHNFELLPFGAGRRGCPGRIFSMAINERALATLLYEFNWSLPQGVRPEDIDMKETFGAANHRQVPLLAVGKPVHV